MRSARGRGVSAGRPGEGPGRSPRAESKPANVKARGRKGERARGREKWPRSLRGPHPESRPLFSGPRRARRRDQGVGTPARPALDPQGPQLPISGAPASHAGPLRPRRAALSRARPHRPGALALSPSPSRPHGSHHAPDVTSRRRPEERREARDGGGCPQPPQGCRCGPGESLDPRAQLAGPSPRHGPRAYPLGDCGGISARSLTAPASQADDVSVGAPAASWGL